MQWLLRFLIGGAAVSLFATVADVLRPKGFAGLFGAAPSVAIATLALTVMREGPSYASIEARSMVLGASALVIYTVGCVYLMARKHMKAAAASFAMLLVWLLAAFSLRFTVLT